MGSSATSGQARLLLLLDASERAGLVPIALMPLHGLAFLANVLAPVWQLEATDGKILKRRGGPFYPALQSDLDRLVGRGLVTVDGISHVRTEDGAWRLEGCYRLNHTLSDPAVSFLRGQPGESRLAPFVLELAYAFSSLADSDLVRALQEDATYSDPGVSPGNVIDFDEWSHANPSAGAANFFGSIAAQVHDEASPGERLHLYMRHLGRRLHDD